MKKKLLIVYISDDQTKPNHMYNAQTGLYQAFVIGSQNNKTKNNDRLTWHNKYE